MFLYRYSCFACWALTNLMFCWPCTVVYPYHMNQQNALCILLVHMVRTSATVQNKWFFFSWITGNFASKQLVITLLRLLELHSRIRNARRVSIFYHLILPYFCPNFPSILSFHSNSRFFFEVFVHSGSWWRTEYRRRRKGVRFSDSFVSFFHSDKSLYLWQLEPGLRP